MTSFVRLLTLALLLALAAAPARARADEQDAKTFFAEGRRKRLAGDCAGAIADFKRALAAWPDGLGALRNIAECQQQLGLAASARRSWWDLRRGVLRLGQEKYRGWDAEAEQAYAALAAKVARLVVRILGVHPAPAIVTVDGEPIAPDLVGTEIERDPGAHAIEARMGASVARRSVVLGEGERREVLLALATAADFKPPPRTQGRPRGIVIGGGVALGVAGLAGIGMAVAGGLRQAALGELSQACPSYAAVGAFCPPAAQDPVTRGQRAANAFNALAAIAGAGALLGGALLLVGLSGSELRPSALWIAPANGGAALGARVRF